jgi:hypothetical protein
MWLDESFGTTTVSDPMNGDRVTFHGCPKHKWLAHKHEKLARKYELTIIEVHLMAQLAADFALFGDAALEPGFTTFGATEELKRDYEEAKLDAARLSASLPIEEVLDIFVRNHRRMMRMAELEPDPSRRKRTVDFLSASEASLRGTYERAQERVAAKHRGLNG